MTQIKPDVFRKAYTVISDDQKGYINEFKDDAEILMDNFEKAAKSPFLNVDPRAMALAKTNLEQAVMWAVKAIT